MQRGLHLRPLGTRIPKSVPRFACRWNHYRIRQGTCRWHVYSTRAGDIFIVNDPTGRYVDNRLSGRVEPARFYICNYAAMASCDGQWVGSTEREARQR